VLHGEVRVDYRRFSIPALETSPVTG
jgi:hypothetical protein